jgi:CHASE2 domain-containing sensor protein/predicted Ser/Thr protein kinase
MRKNRFYTRDWFIALLVGFVFLAAIAARSGLLERLELVAYDVGVRVTHRTPGAADQIVIVAIDDTSIREIGRWPWPRNVLADALNRLSKARPRAVGVLLDLTKPQVDRGLVALRDIRKKVDAMDSPRSARRSLNNVRALLNRAETQLDADRALTRALRRTPHLHLPMFVELGQSKNDADAKPPDYIERYRLRNVVAPSPNAPRRTREISAVRPPLEAFARQTSGIGHLRFRTDPDHGARASYSVLEYDGVYYPSLPVLLAAADLNLDLRSIEFEVGKGFRLGRLFVPTDSAGLTYTGFYSPPPGKDHAFLVVPFRDLQADAVSPTLFTNKIVLIGLSASGIGTAFATPLAQGPPMAEPEVAANVIASLLNEDFYTVPRWAGWADIGAPVVVLLYLMLVVPRLRGSVALLVTLLLLIGVLGAEQFLMVSEKIWVHATTPALMLLVGQVAIAVKRFVLGERARTEAETDSVHSTRMLGLTFQSQGQLDMAMDKFRKLPVDESVLDLIYNLALDFERKRQFHKAAVAYDYILEHDSRFRDCVERRKRASQGDQVVALGTLILDGAAQPTLGRYHIEKELGRGAMGVVYLGRDPKINRLVAIKTMALSQEFEPTALAGARERFFREAETAGRLHHPNIVTIYDVGEDHDLAYIAMEYLEGKELSTYLEGKQQMAFDCILDIAIKVADALAYAHRADVVHRDIKPHNIVYHEATGSVKVMDFGIARITDTSSTKTGVVLGTPAYMSPEQIAGKRVDQRSDLYSLGAMLFEMVTGDTPFDGDSFAALTHQVINAPVPDIRKFRPDTPAPLIAIIKRLLQKKVTKRYQTGEDVKRALEECLAEVEEWKPN